MVALDTGIAPQYLEAAPDVLDAMLDVITERGEEQAAHERREASRARLDRATGRRRTGRRGR